MEKVKYNKVTSFTLTEEQQSQLQREAIKHGVTVSVLIRAMLFNKRRPRGVALGGFDNNDTPDQTIPFLK